MGLGKQVRLGRLFSDPSGRLCAIAVDHFVNYAQGKVPEGLRNISGTLERIVAGRPDAVTMHRGVAASAWGPHAGKVAFILQSSILRIDDAFHEQIADPEDAVRMGADAFAVVAFSRGATEARYMKSVAVAAQRAAPYDMPVIVHAYPRKFGKEVTVSYDPDDIAWAVRCAYECGADIVKAPYCNDVEAYRQIVSECPVPLVAAGGPQTKTFGEALSMLLDVVRSGARGATVGRNVWGFEKVTQAVEAVKRVLHEGMAPQEALEAAGLR